MGAAGGEQSSTSVLLSNAHLSATCLQYDESGLPGIYMERLKGSAPVRLASTVLIAGILCTSFLSVAATAQTPQATPDPAKKPPVIRRIPARNPFIPPPTPVVKPSPSPLIGQPPAEKSHVTVDTPRVPTAVSTPAPSFNVVGIVESGNSKVALLSVGSEAEAVHEGAIVNGYRIVSIRPDQRSVRVTKNKSVFSLHMAESGTRQKSGLKIVTP